MILRFGDFSVSEPVDWHLVDAANACTLGHADFHIASVAPICTPRVPHEEVLHAILDAVAHSSDGMVDRRTTGWAGDDTRAVPRKDRGAGINSHCDSSLGEGFFYLCRIVGRGHMVVADSN